MSQHIYYNLNRLLIQEHNCLDNVLVNRQQDSQITDKIFYFPLSDHIGLSVNLPFIVSTEQSSTRDNSLNIKLMLPKSKIGSLRDNLDSYIWVGILESITPSAQMFAQ